MKKRTFWILRHLGWHNTDLLGNAELGTGSSADAAAWKHCFWQVACCVHSKEDISNDYQLIRACKSIVEISNLHWRYIIIHESLEISPADEMSPKHVVSIFLSIIAERVTMSGEDKNKEIVAQGNKIRELKASKADKGTIKAEVDVLLKLKAEFKSITGKDWKPETEGKAASAKVEVLFFQWIGCERYCKKSHFRLRKRLCTRVEAYPIRRRRS